MREYINDKLVKLTCNNCGRYENVGTGDDVEEQLEPYRKFDLEYNYGSVLFDLEGLEFDLCEHCVDEITRSFKIPPFRKEYDIYQGYTSDGNPLPYIKRVDKEPASQEKIDEMWRNMHKQREND